MDIVKKTVSAVQGELKIEKVVAFTVMLVIAGYVLKFLSAKFPAVAQVSPIK